MTEDFAAALDLNTAGRDVRSSRSVFIVVVASTLPPASPRRPFQGSTGKEILINAAAGRAFNVRSSKPRLPGEIRANLSLCLQADTLGGRN